MPLPDDAELFEADKSQRHNGGRSAGPEVAPDGASHVAGSVACGVAGWGPITGAEGEVSNLLIPAT